MSAPIIGYTAKILTRNDNLKVFLLISTNIPGMYFFKGSEKTENQHVEESDVTDNPWGTTISVNDTTDVVANIKPKVGNDADLPATTVKG
jgi:hypothetical protein